MAFYVTEATLIKMMGVLLGDFTLSVARNKKTIEIQVYGSFIRSLLFNRNFDLTSLMSVFKTYLRCDQYFKDTI